jgi:hypothetical protein
MRGEEHRRRRVLGQQQRRPDHGPADVLSERPSAIAARRIDDTLLSSAFRREG